MVCHLFLISLSTPYLEICLLAWHDTSTWLFSSLLAEVPHFLSLQARSNFHARPGLQGSGERLWKRTVNGATFENRKIFFWKRNIRPIFWWLHKSSFTHFRGSMADSLYEFHSRVLLLLYCHLPDGTATEQAQQCTAMENDVIAAI